MTQRRSVRPVCLVSRCAGLILSGVLSCAQAVELGDARVSSYIGQALVADIELVELADPMAPVQVRVAHADVYRGANVRIAPVLSNLTMSVMRRDGRQFLHITSIDPVDSEYLHLFLDLTEGGQRKVRSATLWLSADPTPPPPPPKPEPEPEPEPRQSAALQAAIARAAMNIPPAPRPQRRAARPAPVCKQQYTDEQIKTCAAIDYKNGVLSAQIVELEDKVKVLQLAMEAQMAPPPPVAKAKLAPAAAAPKPPVSKKAGFPWALAAAIGALLLLIGGAVFGVLHWRKSKGKASAAPAPARSRPAWLARALAWPGGLMARFKRGKKAEEAAPEPAPEEPKLD